MEKITIVINNEYGLHARPANLLIKESSKYESEVSIIRNGKVYNAKSIMGILSMGASKGDELIITTEGKDEKESIESLKKLFESNFGE